MSMVDGMEAAAAGTGEANVKRAAEIDSCFHPPREACR